MNFQEILGGPLGQRLAWTLLHFVWQGLLIGTGAVAAGWLLSPSHTRGRYAIAMIGLVLMACCPLVTFAILQVPAPKPVALAPPPELPVGKIQPPTTVPIPDDIGLPAPSPSRVVSVSPQSARRVVSDTPPTPTPIAPPIEPDWQVRLARRVAAFQPYAVMFWLAGVVALSGRLLMSVLGVRRLARSRLPVAAELAACAARLAQRLGLSASPGIYLSRRIREAMLVGLWRPMVLLPAAWIAEMPPDVLEAVIAHELAHMRRLDLWANLFQRLVETLLFYHPAVWWLSRRASLLREMCADELAVEATGERMTYATVLELLGRQRLNRPAPQLAAGIGGRRMALFARVRNVLGAAPGDERLRWWPAGLLALLVPLGIWLGTMAMLGYPKDAAADIAENQAGIKDEVEIMYRMLRSQRRFSCPEYSINVKDIDGRKLKRVTLITNAHGDSPKRIVIAEEAELKWDGTKRVLKVLFRKGRIDVAGGHSVAFDDYWEFELPFSNAGRSGAFAMATTGDKPSREKKLPDALTHTGPVPDKLTGKPVAARSDRPDVGGQVVDPAGKTFKSSEMAVKGPVPTMDQISAAWTARQKRVRSAKVQWKETEFVEKESMPLLPGMFDSSEPSADKKVEWMPPKDVSLDCTQTVFINDKMSRMDRDGPYWNLPRRDLEQDARVCTSDGEVAKMFWDERTIHELYGFIEPEARNPEYNCYLYWPIAFTFRPCDSDMGGLDLKTCTIHPGLESVGGRTCAVLSAPNMTLWLDPARDFVAVKVREEVTTRTCDILYREDQSHVWVPAEWKTAQILHGKVLERIVAKVTDYKLNADIPRSTFQFEFPVGTYVSVLKKADEGSETSESYIVRPGGKKRLITKEELRRGAAADYQELLRTESGKARGKPRPSKDKSPAANASPGKDWSMTSNDMRVRLLASKGTTYRRGEVLPLVIELQNYGDKPIACNTLWHVVRFPAHDSDDNWIGEPVMGPELADSVGQTDLAPGKTTEVRLSLQSLRFNRPLKAGEMIQLQACVSTQEGRLGQLPLEVLTPSVTIRVQDAFPPDIGAADFPDKWQMNLACELKMGLLGRRRLQIDEKGAAKVLNAYVSITRPAINNFVKVTLPPERLKELAIALRRMQAWKLSQIPRNLLSQIPRNPPPPDSEYIDFSLVCPTGASVVGEYPLDDHKEPIIAELRKLMEDLMNDVEKAAKTSSEKPAESTKPNSPPPTAVKPDESPHTENKPSNANIDPQMKLVKQATENALKRLVSGEGKGTCRRTLTDKQDGKFDFEFAFDGDKFRFVTSEGAGTHYMAVCDGSATLVRDYYVKPDSGSQVAFLKPPEFISLSPMVSSYGRLSLPLLHLPTGPRGILGKVFETRAINVVKLPDGRLHGSYDVNLYVHTEFDATPDSGYHISRAETFNKSGPRAGTIFTAKWKQDKDLWYATAITREDWRQGEVDSRCEVQYTEFKPNPHLADDTFSIRSLRLQPGSTIIDQRPGWSKSYRVGDPDDLGKNKRTMAEDVDSLPMRGGSVAPKHNDPTSKTSTPKPENDLLREFTQEKVFWKQAEIAPKLIAAGDKTVVPGIVPMLASADRQIRCNAGWVLAGLGDERGLPAVLAEMKDTSSRPTGMITSNGSPNVAGQIRADRCLAAHVLGKIGDRRAVPALIEALQDKDIDFQAAITLAHLGDQRAVPALLAVLERANRVPPTSINGNMKFWAGYALMGLGHPLGSKTLREFLDDEHEILRRYAADAFAEFPDKAAVPLLIRATADNDKEVRVNAIAALGKIGDEAALPTLRALLRDSDEEQVRARQTFDPPFFKKMTVREAAAHAIKQIESR